MCYNVVDKSNDLNETQQKIPKTVIGEITLKAIVEGTLNKKELIKVMKDENEGTAHTDD